MRGGGRIPHTQTLRTAKNRRTERTFGFCHRVPTKTGHRRTQTLVVNTVRRSFHGVPISRGLKKLADSRRGSEHSPGRVATETTTAALRRMDEEWTQSRSPSDGSSDLAAVKVRGKRRVSAETRNGPASGEPVLSYFVTAEMELGGLDLDLDVDAGRKLEPLQRIDSLR